MARPLKVENQMMQQSNYFTTARYDYTAQEKRILYRVAEKAYEYRMANKEWFEQHDGEFVANEHVSFTMPITKFMNKEQLENSGGEQYEQVVEAFKSLVDKRISFRGKGFLFWRHPELCRPEQRGGNNLFHGSQVCLAVCPGFHQRVHKAGFSGRYGIEISLLDALL